MVRSADRAELVAQQATALRALTSLDSTADPLDERGYAATRETLVRKRLVSLARHWPALPRELGEDFGALAREYVFTRPRITSDSRSDGRMFATWLEGRGGLPDGTAIELLRFDVCYRIAADGARRRRLPALRFRRRPRLMAAASVPRAGPRGPLVITLGRARRDLSQRRRS